MWVIKFPPWRRYVFQNHAGLIISGTLATLCVAVKLYGMYVILPPASSTTRRGAVLYVYYSLHSTTVVVGRTFWRLARLSTVLNQVSPFGIVTKVRIFRRPSGVPRPPLRRAVLPSTDRRMRSDKKKMKHRVGMPFSRRRIG